MQYLAFAHENFNFNADSPHSYATLLEHCRETERPEKFSPERDSNPDLCEADAVSTSRAIRPTASRLFCGSRISPQISM